MIGDIIAQAAREKFKGLIVLTVNVGSLSPERIEKYIKEILDNLIPDKPAGWKLVVWPTRGEYARVEVFAIEPKGVREVEKYLLDVDAGSLVNVASNGEPLDELFDYVKLMLGAPAVHLTDPVCDAIDYFIDLGLEYRVGSLKRFVADQMADLTYTRRGRVYMKKDLPPALKKHLK